MKNLVKKLMALSFIFMIAFPSIIAKATETNDELRNKALPTIQQYDAEDSNQTWEISATSRLFIVANEESMNNSRLEEVVKLLDSEFAAKSLPNSNVMPIVYGAGSEIASGDIVIDLSGTSKTVNEEGYEIQISDTITMKANSENAVMYGLRTVMNFLITNGGLPYGTIVDYPDVLERSLHIDMARKFYTKDWIIQQIKDMSLLKLNTLQLHFSENEGFRIECETYPEVMSEQYITKAEIREILAVAKTYGIEVIPALDSPGHLKQALANYPEFQLPNSSGGKLNTALNITDESAREFLKNLLDEYMELFAGCKYFHIGADEFIDFNRFNTYPVMTTFAREKYGENATGLDTYVDYINDIAEHVEAEGFIPRIWSDGVYRVNIVQNVELNKSIQITYWTRWDRNMASVQTFIDNGHDLINFNDAYFYYVLGEAAGYKYPKGEKIFDNWHPGKFPGVPKGLSDKWEWEQPYEDWLKGASFAIWSDKAWAQTQEKVADGIYEPLRAMAQKSWNAAANTKTYAEFKSNFEQIGHIAGYDTELPEPSEIVVILKEFNLNDEVNNFLSSSSYTEESYQPCKILIEKCKDVLKNRNATMKERNDALNSMLRLQRWIHEYNLIKFRSKHNNIINGISG